jgi:hypothetical protein
MRRVPCALPAPTAVPAAMADEAAIELNGNPLQHGVRVRLLTAGPAAA